MSEGQRITHHISRITLCSLAFFIFFIPIAQSSLDITVTNFSDEPVEGVKIQIFPGKIYPDSNVEPIAPPNSRNDGLVGFVTNSNGKAQIDLLTGDYTIVAFHPYHPSNFLIVKQVRAPGNVNLSAKDDASPIALKVLRKDGKPMDAADVFLRPCRQARGLVGQVPGSGQPCPLNLMRV